MGLDTKCAFKAGSHLANCIIFIIGIVVAILAWQVSEKTETGHLIMPLSQLSSDWNHVPYTSIEVSKEPCPFKEVFERTWGGTELGCLETNWLSSDEVLTYDDWDRR